MRSKKPYDDAKLETLGARFSSTDVQKEADLAAGLLQRHGPVFCLYGRGQAFAGRFESKREAHRGFVVERTEGVAAKQNAIAGLNETFDAGWTWVEQAHAILGPFCRRDAEFALRVEKLTPEAEAELAMAVAGFNALLEEKKPELDADVPIDDLIAAAAELVVRLNAVLGDKAQAKVGAKSDTRELDRLDGELYLEIADLYDAGRKAVRAGRIHAPMTDFRFRYCVTGRRRPAAEPPTPA
ncbi:MAG: hypothetical protein CVU65_02305 [Deltaproteobacteria bacterium HGW-Deltaproteobacteria-22]|nr:MAG: hypothetical protein CVU65_02305 [Deltaproteobacteria bacterium HGW-Deltaproteobacteria-22]